MEEKSVPWAVSTSPDSSGAAIIHQRTEWGSVGKPLPRESILVTSLFLNTHETNAILCTSPIT